MKTMKKTMMAAAVVMMAGFAAPALAADAPAAGGQTFGVVDMNKVMQVTSAAKDILSQLEAKRKEYQGQISKEEDSLRSAEQEIVKQKDTLTKEAFDAKRKAFEEKYLSGQKLVQDRKRILDQAYNTSMTNIRREAAKIVANIAQEKHYSAVFTQDAVMISTPDLDMTDTVIERMNKDVKKISVDWAAAASASSEEGSAPKSSKKK
jgi:outer membrane protein